MDQLNDFERQILMFDLAEISTNLLTHIIHGKLHTKRRRSWVASQLHSQCLHHQHQSQLNNLLSLDSPIGSQQSTPAASFIRSPNTNQGRIGRDLNRNEGLIISFVISAHDTGQPCLTRPLPEEPENTQEIPKDSTLKSPPAKNLLAISGEIS